MSAVEMVKKKGKKAKKTKENTGADDVIPIVPPPDDFAGEAEKPSSSVISVKEAAEPDKTDNVDEIKDEAVPGTSGGSRPSSARPGSGVSRTLSPPPTVYNGLDQPGTPASGPNPASRPQSAASRSLSPVAKETTPDGSRSGSAASQRSHKKNAVQPFSKERPSENVERPASSMSKTIQSLVSLKEQVDADNSRMQDDVFSISPSTRGQQLGPSEMNETHAYVPYIYARDCIGKIMADMKKMKNGHIRIVCDIESTYKNIEDDTQGQFNTFLYSLRDQYGKKVKTFRQVVEVHRLELQNKQSYWDEALTSLSERNKKLLQDKKALLIKNKIEADEMEKEKGSATSQLLIQLDELTSDKKKLETELENKDKDISKREEEKKVLDEQNGRLQLVINELQSQPQSARLVAAAMVAVDAEGPIKPNAQSDVHGARLAESPVIQRETVKETKAVAKPQDGATPDEEPMTVPVPTVVVQDLSQVERDAMDAERQTIKSERSEIEEERSQIEAERETFANERKKFQEDRVIWQGDLNNSNKDGETWKAKYQGLKDQLGELADLRAKYQALQLQFSALAAMATITTEEDKQKADEKIKKAEQDKDIMEEERLSMEAEISKWEEDFKQRNNREPKESEKPNSVKELETSRNEAQNMIAGLDAQVDTLQTLKRGDVPVAPEVAPQPISISEPEVKIVEVYVPDPETAAQLEKTQAEIQILQTKLVNVKKQFNDVRNDNTNLQGEVADAVWELKKSETINKEQDKKLLQQAREIQKLSKGGRPTTVASRRPGTAGGDGLAIAEMERELRDKEQEIKDLELKHKEQLKTQEIAAEKKQKSTENDIKKLLKEIAKMKKKVEAKKEADPAPETELEKAEDAAYSLEDKILDMETKVTNLNSDKELLNNINSDLRQRLSDYGHDLGASEDKVVTLGAATVSAADPTQDEVDDLQEKVRQLEEKILEKENLLDEKVREHARDLEDRDKKKKEMEKDMKKLLKHIAKLREQLKEAKGEAKEEDSVQKSGDLSTSLSDLQTDNDHLKDTNEGLESRVSDLEQQISESEERMHELELKADLDIDLQNAKDQIQDLREKIRALEGDIRGRDEDLRQKDRDLRDKDHQAKEQEREHEKQIREKQKVESEMQKDMKKMLKEIAKLRRKLAAAGGDTKEDVSDEAERLEKEIEKLEDKVTQLENQLTDVEGEKTDAESNKQEYDERVAELERELEEAREQAAEGPTGDYGGSSVAFTTTASSEDIEELNRQINVLQKQVDITEKEVREERSSHDMTREELQSLQAQIKDLKSKLDDKEREAAAKLDSETSKLNSEINNLQQKLASSQERVVELDKARLANIPVDTAKEISQLQAKVEALDQEKDVLRREVAESDGDSKELKAKIKSLEGAALGQKTAGSDAEAKFKYMKAEKDKEIKQLQGQMDKKERERQLQEQKKINALDKKIRELEAQVASGGGAGVAVKGGKPAKGMDPKAIQQLQEKLREAKMENAELRTRVKQLEKSGGGGGGGTDFETQKLMKKQEKLVKELEKIVDNEKKKNKKNEDNLNKQNQELTDNKREIRQKDEEISHLKAEMTKIGASAADAAEMATKIQKLEMQVKSQDKEIKTVSENFNTERVLRKKYYNMVEDMKGKIRVYCRVRPMSGSELDRGNTSVIKSPDEYSCIVDTFRGVKEFQFDTVFMPDSSQEKVFEDTNNLVQSAVDGYNVCIFAYGQTGSGKTFTIIGDREGKYPGIAPRAFERIYELLNENKSKFSYRVSVYMMELYNEKLIDLFAKPGTSNEEKMDIKKDKKGMVVVAGSEVKAARNAKELYALFEEGSKGRHTSSTKMNAESSRSHLVVGIVIETTNKTTGSVVKGKLSLVDLAGSERAAKTGASAEQLKEAMSINKSLSALGDVISALSSEQSFIPYRNNKLTMLMQDSLGGNAKTLMFVNISPADYNADESVVSLTYASRVKLITNDAQKNSDNKEIARLKNLITKMKKGEAVDVEEEVEED